MSSLKRRGDTLKSSSALNIFAGRDSLLDFLDPGKCPPTPLVELPPELNRYHAQGVRIFMKLLYMTPIFNAKLFASRELFNRKARGKKRIKGVHTLIENSSGNKILADRFLARAFGIKRVIGTVPHDIPSDKQLLLELFGVECRKELDGIGAARKLGKRRGWWNPAQYDEDGNPAGSERWLAPQLWEQTRGKITVFGTSVGTGGTYDGTFRGLRRYSRKIVAVPVMPLKDEVPGTRTRKRAMQSKVARRAGLVPKRPSKKVQTVDTVESYFWSLRLCSRGILSGVSGGAALAGLFKFLKKESANNFRRIRNSDGEVVCVVVCHDSCLLYLNKYSTRLTPREMLAAIA